MSTQPAPTYNPEPFNPIIYENLKGEAGDIDFLDNATLENCNINDSTLTNCVFVGPIYSGPIKSKTYTIENDSGLDSAALTSVGNANNNVDLNFLPGVGSTNSTSFTVKNNSVVQHSLDLSGNASHAGNVILNGANKSLQLNSTGGIYCGGAATTVTQQELAYLTGTSSNIQNQLNNLNTGSLTSTSTTNLATVSGNVCIGNTNSAYKLDVDGNLRIRGGAGTTGAEFCIEDDPNNFTYSGFGSFNKGLKIFWNYPALGSGRTCFLNNGQGQSVTNGFDFYMCGVSQNTPIKANINCGEIDAEGNVIISGTNKNLQLSSTSGINCSGAAITVSQQEISYLSGATSNIQSQINNISGNSQDLTPRSVTITSSSAALDIYSAGIKNRYNTGGILGFYGSGTQPYGSTTYGCYTTKVVISSNFLQNIQAISSLFRITFVQNDGQTFWLTKFYLQIYPNRLFNNTNYDGNWTLLNKINGNSNYLINNDPTYAPLGRWYWVFDQNFSNLDGPPQGWIVPQLSKINILFAPPRVSTTLYGGLRFECSVECLDSQPVNDVFAGWEISAKNINDW